jgi:ribosomal protein S18 acetylase RimI-like enzyme
MFALASTLSPPLPPPFSLRAATSADQDFLDALYFSSREDLHAVSPDAHGVAQLVRMQQQMQQAGFNAHYPQAQHWLVQRAGQAIGRVVLDFGAADVRLVDLAIIPASRRAGAATAVLQAVQAMAHAQGLAVSLAVSQANAGAMRLYQRLGFDVSAQDVVQAQMRWQGVQA